MLDFPAKRGPEVIVEVYLVFRPRVEQSIALRPESESDPDGALLAWQEGEPASIPLALSATGTRGMPAAQQLPSLVAPHGTLGYLFVQLKRLTGERTARQTQ